MTGEQCAYFLNTVLKATEAQTRSLMTDADRAGWTLPMEIGPMRVSLARIPNNYGTRSMNYQVTVK